jgi:SAM-dependent methyltransferase
MKNSKSYYNSTADTYNEQSLSKVQYLNAVDEFIVGDLSKTQLKNYLDIGTGDGRRALKLKEKLNISDSTVLVDDSEKMLSHIKNLASIKIVNDTIFNYKPDIKFSLITCLWNVLGHFPSKDLRIEFFKIIETILEPEGVFIFDVNNRYNIEYYGHKNVAVNLKKDHLNIDNAGWFDLGEGSSKTKVYIHSPFDINRYLEGTKLVLEYVAYIDYETGELKDTFFEGQLVYKISKPD